MQTATVRKGSCDAAERRSDRPIPPSDLCERGRQHDWREDELYRKVPDVDFYDQLRTSTDTHVAIAIRGLGEMEPADPADPGSHPSRVDLSSVTDEYGIRRASVVLTPTQRDQDLWDAMDAAMQKVATIFANGQPMQVVQQSRRAWNNHHETGPLMGTDPTRRHMEMDATSH